MAKPPRLPHVKYVRARGQLYAYFNTGQTKNGKTIYAPLPRPGSVGFFDSYASFMGHRTKRLGRPQYNVAAMADDYMASADFAKLAAATQAGYAKQLRKVVEIWGKFPVGNLQPAHVRKALAVKQWNPGTHSMVVAVLGALYAWGRRAELTDMEPTRDIARPKGGQHEPWPEDIVEAALACDAPLVRLAVHLLYFTGQRIGDVTRLRWNDIRGDVLYLAPQKTKRHGKRLEIPLHAELREELARTHKQGILILNGITSERLRKELQAFTRALGAETVPHGLRKNAVNTLLEKGCTIAQVASITGQTFKVVEHYAARINNRKLGQAAMLKFEAGRGTRKVENNAC